MRSSLKIKLLFILVGLAVFILLSFATLALKDFEKDKIAYVFDSLLSHSRSTSVQVRTDIDNAVDKVKFYMRGFNTKTGQIHPYAQSIFQTDDAVEFIAALKFDSTTGEFDISQKLVKDKELNEAFQNELKSLAKKSLSGDIALLVMKDQAIQWLFGVKYDNRENPNRPIVLVLGSNRGNFVETILRSSIQDSYLLDNKDQIVAEPADPIYQLGSAKLNQVINSIKTQINSEQGVTEIKMGKDDVWLTSRSAVGVNGLKVISVVSKQTALQTLTFIKYKAGVFLLFLICVIVIVSLISAGRLTANLRRLTQATKKISEGIFDVNVSVKSKDEMGQLANNFNSMAAEIQRLLQETAEKSRMENELKTAKTVQSTLFPEATYKDDHLEISGFYEPASECGGDWWFHSHNHGKSYLWIGDATGHGAPAALVTAAARAASTIIKQLPQAESKDIAQILNEAIYGTAKGEVLMTFFVAIYDPQTKNLQYTNASHDPPLLFPNKSDALKKKDLITLNDTIGKRLGQDPTSVYESSNIEVSPGDRIVFYTDGVTELKNPEGAMLGERTFVRTLLGQYNEDRSNLNSAVDGLGASLEEFRNNHPLEDDVTYFMTQFH